MRSQAASGHGRKEGFTIFELLIVMSISAVILLFTIPVAISYYQRQLVDDTARLLVDTLRRAHDSAIAQKDSQPHGVKINTASSTFVHFEGTTYASRVTSADEAIGYPPNLSITGTSTEVTFSKLYGTSTISDLWNVNLDGVTSTISINTQGTIDLQ